MDTLEYSLNWSIFKDVNLAIISTNLLRTIKYRTNYLECSFNLIEYKTKMGREEYYETLHNKFREVWQSNCQQSG